MLPSMWLSKKSFLYTRTTNPHSMQYLFCINGSIREDEKMILLCVNYVLKIKKLNLLYLFPYFSVFSFDNINLSSKI